MNAYYVKVQRKTPGPRYAAHNYVSKVVVCAKDEPAAQYHALAAVADSQHVLECICVEPDTAVVVAKF